MKVFFYFIIYRYFFMMYSFKNCNDSSHLCTIWKSTVYSCTHCRWPSSYTWWNTCLRCCSYVTVSWGTSPLLCTSNSGYSYCRDGRANHPPSPGPRSLISAWCDGVRRALCKRLPRPERSRGCAPLPVPNKLQLSTSMYVFKKLIKIDLKLSIYYCDYAAFM